MKIQEALKKGVFQLKENQIETPKMEARLLMQYVLVKPREYIMVYDQKELTKKEEEKYFEVVEKRVKGIPIQQITHSQEFMKLHFYINENVLIPRPDTEILVEEVIKIAKTKKKPKILDLCTGSGAIAISLAKELSNSEIYASDISKKALEVAKKNEKENKLQTKIHWIESDLFKKIEFRKFDIIVSNPPYIKTEILDHLAREVKQEPMIALDGGKDGLDYYRRIIKKASEYLKLNGYLCFEIGYDQKIDVIELIENENQYGQVESKKDYYQNDRVVMAKMEG